MTQQFIAPPPIADIRHTRSSTMAKTGSNNGSNTRSAGAGASQRSHDQGEQQKRFSAYLVIPPPESAPANAKPFWQRVAPAYPHSDGEGYDIVVPQGMALSGRITVRLDKPREDRGGDQGHED
jgi:hypothetical protein